MTRFRAPYALAMMIAAAWCATATAQCGDPLARECCIPNGTPGCNDLSCCTAVCDVDPNCCINGWDQLCAATAHELCLTLCAGQPIIESMQFHQITFDTVDTGFVPDSEYGLFVITYIPQPLILQWFLQIVADVGNGPGWIVRNFPLIGLDITNSGLETFTTQFDLGELGIARGDPMTGTLINYGIQLTPDPVLTPTVENLQLVGVIQPALADHQGANDDADGHTPDLPAASLHPDRDPPSGTTRDFAWRGTFDNKDVGLNQCTPASMANSIHWLAQQYPGDINLGTQTWYQTLAKLKTDLKFNCPQGTLLRNIVPGKLRFFQREDKFFSPGWKIKYQADAKPFQFPKGYAVGNLVGCRAGASAAPDFDWIMSELQAGEDVEIHIGWYRQNGTRNGGHSMVVRGALRHGNKEFIWITHDWDQEGNFTAPDGTVRQTVDERCARPKPDDNTPAQDPGLETRLCQIVTDDDGFMSLTCFRSLNKVELVTSESPPDGTGPSCCPWDCDGSNDGIVGVDDFLAVLAQWGQTVTSCHFAGNDVVGIDEFLAILAHWGPCP